MPAAARAQCLRQHLLAAHDYFDFGFSEEAAGGGPEMYMRPRRGERVLCAAWAPCWAPAGCLAGQRRGDMLGGCVCLPLGAGLHTYFAAPAWQNGSCARGRACLCCAALCGAVPQPPLCLAGPGLPL